MVTLRSGYKEKKGDGTTISGRHASIAPFTLGRTTNHHLLNLEWAQKRTSAVLGIWTTRFCAEAAITRVGKL